MTKLNLAYVAGLFDGEGCLTWAVRTPRATITSCYPHHLRWIRDSFGFGSVVNHARGTGTSRHSYRYQVYGSNCERFVSAIRPYLREKRHQADIILLLVNSMPRTEYRRALQRGLSEAKRVEYV
jgi:hypothetical protein